MELTEMERNNLNQLKRFNQFDWFVEASKHNRGAYFGELALETEKKESLRHKITVKTMTKCEMAVLRRADFLKVMKKIEGREVNNRATFLMGIPYFQHLSIIQVKKLTHQFESVNYMRQQYVYKQGDMPKYIYIVVDGDFEILRHKKNKYKLIDPTKIESSQNKVIEVDQLLTLLGPKISKSN